MISYDNIAHIIKLGGTLAFFLFFVGVIAYALWPKNKTRFENASKIPLSGDSRPNV